MVKNVPIRVFTRFAFQKLGQNSLWVQKKVLSLYILDAEAFLHIVLH